MVCAQEGDQDEMTHITSTKLLKLGDERLRWTLDPAPAAFHEQYHGTLQRERDGFLGAGGP